MEDIFMSTINDRLWIWGHPTNSLKGCFGLTMDSDVSPVDGAEYLGANNIFYVPMGRPVDRDLCTQQMQHIPQVGWSMEREEQVWELIELKKKYPNITKAVFDDFFNPENVHTNFTNYSVKKMLEMKEKLHEAGIEMWVVLYTRLLENDIRPYLKLFDGVSYWYWHEASEEEFNEKIKWLFENTPGQKKMVGCYLYDFGNEREMPAETVRSQLDKNLTFIREGKIEGIILHTNAIGGMGYVGYEEAKIWAEEHSNEVL